MTTPAAPPGIVQSPWPAAFGADFQGRLLTVIVEGSPIARSWTPLPTMRTGVAFGVLDLADPSWGAELDEVPDLSKDQSTYEVGVSRLSGSILISQESLDDADFPVTAAVSQVVQDTFSAKLDRDLVGAAGPHPTPTGILSVAPAADGADLELAAIAAKASIATAGGTATHIALSPNHLAGVEGARDDLGRQLYPDAATRFAGLQTVVGVAATQPIVYAADRLWLVVRRDFQAEMSRETSAAWNHFAQSLRMVGRFAVACPQPSRAARKLTVAGAAPASAPRAKGGKAA